MQKIFDITNKYIVLATPLILYSLISSVYLIVSAGSGKIINLIFAILLFTLMTGAFISGWFNMIKLAIIEPEREDPNSLIKEFPAGVGEYFLPALGLLFVGFVVSTIMAFISHYIGISSIGNPNISAEALAEAFQNTASLKTFAASLTVEQLTKLNLWNMLILGTITLIYFLMFLYLPALFFKTKNPFVAYFISLKDLFSRKILKTIGLFLLIFAINFIISILTAILGQHSVMHFIMTLINFYFITLVGVGVFHYYHNNFVKQNIGQNVDVKI